MARESGRLARFIRRRVADVADAEDILQEVFSELVELTRMRQPIEEVGAWLFSVAWHRIIGRFRKRRQTVSTSDPVGADEGLPLPGWPWVGFPAGCCPTRSGSAFGGAACASW
jgi:DNA-directed RNA polymerase specialized sigma24 family protein